jgi:hypothetical protein
LTALLSAAAAERILVMNLQANQVPGGVADSLSEILLAEIRKHAGGAEVVGRAEIEAMLAFEQQKDLLGCSDDTACLAQIGGALGAGLLVTGTLGKLGGTYLLHVKMIDTVNAKVKSYASEQVKGDEEQLIAAATRMAQKVMGVEVAPPPVVAAAPTPPPAAVAPPSQVVAPPPVAAEAAEVEAPGSWYGKWWVWALVAGVGGGAVAVYAWKRGQTSGTEDLARPVRFEIDPRAVR